VRHTMIVATSLLSTLSILVQRMRRVAVFVVWIVFVRVMVLHNVNLVIQDRAMACIMVLLLLAVLVLLHLLLLLTRVLQVFCAGVLRRRNFLTHPGKVVLHGMIH
jgi:hypothetical protein